MRSDFHFISTSPSLFNLGVLSLFFISLGFSGILTKKPFLISSRWVGGVLLVTLGRMLLWIPFRTFSLSPWLMSAMTIVFFIFMWLALPDYIGLGLTDSSFREGLVSALEKLEIPFEENLGGMYLPSIGANLRLVGTGISIRPGKFNGVLRDVIRDMSSYYQTANVSANLSIFYFHLILSAFYLLMWVVYF